MAQVLNIRKSALVENKVQKYAVALCRVSTEDQFTKGISVPEQAKRIQKWADKNHVKIVKWAQLHHSAYRGLDEDPEILELSYKVSCPTTSL